jgi:ADP-L-glycero-D-manno-heptose 6-epimerase
MDYELFKSHKKFKRMIIVTGGEGFIGQNLIKELNRRSYMNVISLDTKSMDLDNIFNRILQNAEDIDAIFHLGAITDTTIMDRNLFDEYNVVSSMYIWNICATYNIPLIYASSAATYGDGSLGFDDEKDIINLKPLNPYGWSKQQFDVWIETQEKQPPLWYGLKFFNVYGFGESHKGNMASVVFHSYNQINETGKIKLFKSHNSRYNNGEQLRDFIYVEDIVDVCIWMYNYNPVSGIYNVGTGKSRTFKDLAKGVFKSLGKEENISYIDMPAKLKDQYQYFTEAKMSKLKSVGYNKPFHELEEGVFKYINKLKS